MRIGRPALALVSRPAVPPPALVLVCLNVGLQRLVLLWLIARVPPNPALPVNAGHVTAFFETWHGAGAWAGSLGRCFMLVNLLLALWLWAELRSLPRGSFAERCRQLVAYGGAALLLVYLQHALLAVGRIEPGFRILWVLRPGPWLSGPGP